MNLLKDVMTFAHFFGLAVLLPCALARGVARAERHEIGIAYALWICGLLAVFEPWTGDVDARLGAVAMIGIVGSVVAVPLIALVVHRLMR